MYFDDEKLIPDFEDSLTDLKNTRIKNTIKFIERFPNFWLGIFNQNIPPIYGKIGNQTVNISEIIFLPVIRPVSIFPFEILTELDRQLNLSDDQLKKVDTITNIFYDFIQNQNENGVLSEKILEELMFTTDEELEKIMDTEQKMKYLKMIEHRNNFILRDHFQFD